jgi:hypothetical protein
LGTDDIRGARVERDPDARKARMAERRRLEEALENIYTHSDPGVRVATRDELCDLVRARLGDEAITYLEFGVKGGRSMSRIAARFGHGHARFVGFDSFEGLPEAWWNQEAGKFSTAGKVPGTRDPRVRFVKGWFQNTLPGFLASFEPSRDAPLLVHFDADLYGSTLFVLAQLWERTHEYYFMFDEFMHDEAIALYDFSRAFPVELEFYAQTTTSVFKQVFGRMRRVEFKPVSG